MISTFLNPNLAYTINSTETVSGSVFAVAGNKYITSTDCVLTLPSITVTPVGSVVVFEQNEGESEVRFWHTNGQYKISHTIPSQRIYKFVLKKNKEKLFWAIFDIIKTDNVAAPEVDDIINKTKTDIDFVDVSPVNDTDGAYELQESDDKRLVVSNGTVTIPTALPVGFQCSVFNDQNATNQLLFPGVTLKGKDVVDLDPVNLSAYGTLSMIVIAENTVLVSGQVE